MITDHDRATIAAAADAAREAIKPFFRTSLPIENKLDEGFDPVTQADKASEQAIRRVLAQMAPDDAILGEEFGAQSSTNDRQWVIDPIDGTRAFIAGLPTWTVLIALSIDGQPQLGVIDQPYIGERFIGSRDASFLEHQGEVRALETSKVTKFKHSMLATTDPYLFNSDEKAAFDMIRHRCKLHRFGFDAYGYAMLAGGGLDLVIESGLQPYDVQALIPIIEGAGGYITNWSGGSAAQGGQVVATGSEELHALALSFLKHVASD
ncbi:MAG: histidinol-phosphatase [Maricaulis sp.]|uniref:histidinol-phosphatase n=1 Tax=Maricaulis sp. TaxID=1486257 RepID=UPI001B1000D7|nr:histidinol-phosphatase [Maricaulis sp.]MBO6730246.1 histidinol-phosphatase [Maricaulis sp.]MBO6848400.1 histidinol-phosphatase [Maricaulis sp.]MBO6878228.1 histidinol-phosphatase [Maricaulis sp.]MDM7984733.1 histidinol-phosphatase [Maricaulis sp.]